MIDFYNQQLDHFLAKSKGVSKRDLLNLAERMIDTDPMKISWSSSLKEDLIRGRLASFSKANVGCAFYRPFVKTFAYIDDMMIHRMSQLSKIFPTTGHPNLIIAITGIGANKEPSVLMTNSFPDYLMLMNGQSFPLYVYEKDESKSGELFNDTPDGELIKGYRRRSAITDDTLKDFRAAYGPKVSKEDIFYYVYGILHSPEYRGAVYQ
jgi:predicted helicase